MKDLGESKTLSEPHVEQNSIMIRPITSGDAKMIARVHGETFPDYFLTRLGPKILELFYREFVDNPEAFGFVAVNGDQIVGFVAGLLNPSNFYRMFYRKNFGSLVFAVLASLIRYRSLIHQLVKRVQHVLYALRSRFRVGNEEKNIAGLSPVPARLLSIGILPTARGMGIAEKLVDELAQEFILKGFETMGLSVFANNHRAIAFYEKTGWKCELNTGTSLSFIRSTSLVGKSN